MKTNKFKRYDMSDVKLRSNTSHMVNDRIYYIVKKFPDGKASKLFTAYDFKSGISVYWHQDKSELIKWLESHRQKIEDKFTEVGE